MTTTENSTATSASPTDQIEEQVELQSPRSRVWRALTNADELGAWFGANLAGNTIAPGAKVVGPVTHKGYEHVMIDLVIEDVEPETRFSWRWHPDATDSKVDLSSEPRTLVTFLLEESANGGTLLRVVESGFEGVASSRRAAAFLGNSKGWAGQIQKRIPAYLAANP